MERLTPEEREVVVTYNDADRTWHVFSDLATLRRTVLKLAQQVGADVKHTGQGIEFDCSGDVPRLAARRRLRLSSDQREARRVRAPRRMHSVQSKEATSGVLVGVKE